MIILGKIAAVQELSDGSEWFVQQQLQQDEEEKETESDNSEEEKRENGYGFGFSYSGIYSKCLAENQEILDVKDPDSLTKEERR